MTHTNSARTEDRTLAVTAVAATLLFAFFSIIGNYGPDLMANGLCFKYFGCNSGFFGFDAVVHLVSGIAETAVILMLMRRFPSFSVLHSSFWKDLLFVLSLALLIGFIWEFVEFIPDQYRVLVLHANLTSPDRLYQASNNDTMGDLLATMFGALLVAVPFIRSIKRR